MAAVNTPMVDDKIKGMSGGKSAGKKAGKKVVKGMSKMKGGK